MSDTLTFAKALLERPSLTPKDEGCQQIIANRLEKIGFTITHFPINSVTNLWAKYHHDNGPTLCFAGHTDVVPTGDLSAWISPPFAPTIRDGLLFARGAADMKSAIAAMITACERFISKHPRPKGGIAFLITSDEEGLAEDGTKAVLKKLQALNQIPTWCLVGEASSVDKLGDTIKVGRRGSLTGYLKIIGKQGHVAYPQLALNPIHQAFLPLREIAEFKWDEKTPLFPATSLQFANIKSGTGANNVIPGSLEADFNCRFSPQLTAEFIQQKVEEILNKHSLQYEIRWRLSGKPFLTPVSSRLVNIVAATIETELGFAPIHSTSGGTSDGRFFAEYGTEVVEVGPINASIHQVNECIAVDELEKLSKLYERFLEALVA